LKSGNFFVLDDGWRGRVGREGSRAYAKRWAEFAKTRKEAKKWEGGKRREQRVGSISEGTDRFRRVKVGTYRLELKGGGGLT